MVANPLFFAPKYALLVPKIPLFDGYFALFGHVFHGSLRVCLYNHGELLCVLYCVLHHFALHLAPFYLAFCTKTQCILRHIAPHLATNSPKCGANCGFMQCVFILLTFATGPFLPQNKPSRESNFCGKVGDWWIKRLLLVLNFLPKSLQ